MRGLSTRLFSYKSVTESGFLENKAHGISGAIAGHSREATTLGNADLGELQGWPGPAERQGPPSWAHAQRGHQVLPWW